MERLNAGSTEVDTTPVVSSCMIDLIDLEELLRHAPTPPTPLDPTTAPDVLATEGDDAPTVTSTKSASDGAIMLVDGDEDGRVMLSFMLELKGMHVLAAGDAETALRQAAAYPGPIALLITEVILPGGLPGDELARRLRALRPELEVLFLSGFPPTDAIRREGEFMLKPVELDQLVARARRR